MQGKLFETQAAIGQYGQPIEPVAESAIARKSDPLPSHAGAADIGPKLGKYHRIFLEILIIAHRGLTAQEVAARAFPIVEGMSPQRILIVTKQRDTTRKRASWLLDAKLINKSTERICESTGKLASEYSITEAGRAWYRKH